MPNECADDECPASADVSGSWARECERGYEARGLLFRRGHAGDVHREHGGENGSSLRAYGSVHDALDEAPTPRGP